MYSHLITSSHISCLHCVPPKCISHTMRLPFLRCPRIVTWVGWMEDSGRPKEGRGVREMVVKCFIWQTCTTNSHGWQNSSSCHNFPRHINCNSSFRYLVRRSILCDQWTRRIRCVFIAFADMEIVLEFISPLRKQKLTSGHLTDQVVLVSYIDYSVLWNKGQLIRPFIILFLNNIANR